MEHHSISWIQIPCTDLERAAKFYNAVFDAHFRFETLNNIPHAIFVGGKVSTKLMNGTLIEVKEMTKSEPGVVLFFDATGNFENILKMVVAYGGKVITPKTLITKKESENQAVIPNTYIDNKPGYYAHFTDSEGNKMGLYGSN